MTLGDLVRQRRLQVGITQVELADRIGAPHPYLSQIENGGKIWPRKYVACLARELDLTMDEMRRAAGRPHSLRTGDAALARMLSSYLDEDRARDRIIELLPGLHGIPLALILQAVEANILH